MLWAFDILPFLEDGKEIIPSADDFITGLVTRPANLRYRLSTRSKGVEELIMLEAERAEMEAKAWQ